MDAPEVLKKYIRELRAEIHNAKRNSQPLSFSTKGKINYVADINPKQVSRLGLK